MSYCKFGPDSDVYVYPSTHYPDNMPCWVLMLDAAQEPEILFSRQEIYDRLIALRGEGRRMPDTALERLQQEMEDEARNKKMSEPVKNKERRYKVVYIHPTLLCDLFAAGPPTYTQCIEGLPPDARFVTQHYDLQRDAHGLIFESDTWEPVPFGETLPVHRVTYRLFNVLSLLEQAETLISTSYDPQANQWLAQWRELKKELVPENT